MASFRDCEMESEQEEEDGADENINLQQMNRSKRYFLLGFENLKLKLF
jgi:hypothetical protein